MLVHLDQAVPVLLEAHLHELGIDEQRVRLHRPGHEHAGGVEDRPATGEQDFLGVLLSLGALQRLLPPVGLQVCDADDQNQQQQGDADKHSGGAGGRERAHDFETVR